MSDDKPSDPTAEITERWIEQAQRRTAPPELRARSEREELAFLHKEHRRLLEETAILRRAIAFFHEHQGEPENAD